MYMIFYKLCVFWNYIYAFILHVCNLYLKVIYLFIEHLYMCNVVKNIGAMFAASLVSRPNFSDYGYSASVLYNFLSLSELSAPWYGADLNTSSATDTGTIKRLTLGLLLICPCWPSSWSWPSWWCPSTWRTCAKLARDSARYSKDNLKSESMRQKDMRSTVFLSTNIPETSTTWHSMLVLIKEYVSKKLKTTYLTVNEGFL